MLDRADGQYYPYMNTPVESRVTLYTEPAFHAQLKEDILEGDPDSQLRDEVRAFHGLSANGDVTAKYVYAGYGLKKDYDLLAERGMLYSPPWASIPGGCTRTTRHSIDH